tara:strand:+ start:315 stop:551 length:237 start_codon:yes stop_codon:yes gene_type:complete
MNFVFIIFLIFFSFTGSAYSFPKSELNVCISNALSNPTTKEKSVLSITNYCECALTAIIDEKKNIRESGLECALKNFN